MGNGFSYHNRKWEALGGYQGGGRQHICVVIDTHRLVASRLVLTPRTFSLILPSLPASPDSDGLCRTTPQMPQ